MRVYDNKTTTATTTAVGETLNDTEHNKNSEEKRKRTHTTNKKIILDVKYNMYKNHHIYT